MHKDNFTELLAVQHEELTTKDLMELEAQRQDQERQEEEAKSEELKGFMMQEMARGFYLRGHYETLRHRMDSGA